ncbi:MAG: hypothetical protein ACNS62_17030 [Candidatus Cyclobacteriaceae bacterium M3_2C_046]
MPTRIIILLILIALILIHCQEKNEPVSMPIADFEMDRDISEDGDLVQFTNKIQYAVRYTWLFGTNEISHEESPLYDPGKLPGLGRHFSVMLMAYNSEDQNDSIIKYCIVSKRVIVDHQILEISESFRQKIPQKDGKDTKLVIYTGPLNEPLEWIEPEQTYPERIFFRDQPLPFRFWYGSWTKYGMTNENWFFRLSFKVDGAQDRVKLKEFIFNPIKMPYQLHPLNPDKLKYFYLQDEDIKLEVIFNHIEPIIY